MRLLIVIPAYNESENIERVVHMLESACPEFDYVVVNDGSKDATARICREKGYPLLDLPVNLGLAGGFQLGMRYATEKGYDAVLQFDGDGQHDPHYIRKMVRIMEREDVDIVIGSRYMTENKPWTARMIGSRVLTTAIRLTTGKTIKDPTSGMRLFGKRVLEEFASEINYSPEPDTLCYLMRNGVSVVETQVEMHDRIAGESYLNLVRSMDYMLGMCVSIFFVQWFRKRG